MVLALYHTNLIWAKQLVVSNCLSHKQVRNGQNYKLLPSEHAVLCGGDIGSLR